MTLNEMTVDEAIALACREVPGCWPLDVTKDDDLDPPIRLRGSGIPVDVFRALWFDAAWEWLMGQPEHFEPSCGSFTPAKCPGGWHDGQYPSEVLPTKYHALAAACLTAAGKEVP